VHEHRTIVDGRIVGVLARPAEGIVEDRGLVLGGEEGGELRVPRVVRRGDVEPRPRVGDEAPCRRAGERALDVVRPRIDRQPLGEEGEHDLVAFHVRGGEGWQVKHDDGDDQRREKPTKAGSRCSSGAGAAAGRSLMARGR
jgi:hypothetical protein